MNNAMDHDRCSELLRPYLQDELKEDDRGAVAAHLGSCAECSGEERALKQMLSVEAPPLSDAERTGLHNDVKAHLAPPTRVDLPTRMRDPLWRKHLGRRLVPALGAAAMILLGVVFAANLVGGDDEGGGEGASVDQEAGRGEGEEGAPEVLEDEVGEAPRPVPYFKPGKRNLKTKDLDRLAKSEGAFRSLKGLPAAKADALVNSYAVALSEQAPPEAQDQVQACVESVTESQGSVVPTYGAQGKYKGEDALLIGFVSREDSGPLNRYMLWLWPKGSCDVPLEYRSGVLEE